VSHTLSLLTQDKPGVLARIASVCARRGYNIRSLAVAPLHEPGLSRITLVVDADHIEATVKQFHKLVNVVEVSELTKDDAVERELMLIQVGAGSVSQKELLDSAKAFDARVVDLAPDSVTFEVVGLPDTLATFVEAVRPYGVMNLAKSGRVSLARASRPVGNQPGQ
jgi:acetolactate synthase-1/3 small subunit